MTKWYKETKKDPGYVEIDVDCKYPKCESKAKHCLYYYTDRNSHFCDDTDPIGCFPMCEDHERMAAYVRIVISNCLRHGGVV